MPTKVIILPPNLAADKKFEGKSVYTRDYCYRHRHGRRITTPVRSYTSLSKKQQNGMKDTQLSDHYPTHTAVLYERPAFENVVQNSKSKSNSKQENTSENNGVDLNDTGGALVENAPAALQQIEEAWLDDLDTTKRERENRFGLAGNKMNLHPRKDKGHLKTKSLPGLDKWLSTANEYEKQVVHKFVTQMRDSYQRPGSTRSLSTPADLALTGNQLIKPKEGRSVRINSKLISPRLTLTPPKQYLQSPPRTPQAPPPTPPAPPAPREPSPSSLAPPSSPPAPPGTPPEPPSTPPRSESALSCRSQQDESEVCDVSTQLPYPSDGKPSSPLYEAQRKVSVASSVASSTERPATVPISKEHTCNKCDACKKKLLKKMIDQLAGTQLASYEDLLKEKVKNQNTMSSRMYEHPQLYEGYDDYIHPGCTFQRVMRHQKGHFTIHPDFVSENVVDMKRLRRKHEKYFGESKVPAY